MLLRSLRQLPCRRGGTGRQNTETGRQRERQTLTRDRGSVTSRGWSGEPCWPGPRLVVWLRSGLWSESASAQFSASPLATSWNWGKLFHLCVPVCKMGLTIATAPGVVVVVEGICAVRDSGCECYY